MVLVSYILDLMDRFKKIKKLKFVQNTVPDNKQRVLTFMRNPDWHIFLLKVVLLLL